jgi:plastocyanin
VRPILILPALAVSALLAGCGGTSATGGRAISDVERAHPHATANQRVLVTIKDGAFQRADVHVKPHQAVEFVNEDAVAHTVTATQGARFDSGALGRHAGYIVVPKRPGTIDYVCSIHPGMRGTITIG